MTNTITHLGKTYSTDMFYPHTLDHARIEHIRENYFNEDKEKALIQLDKFLKGGLAISDINKYYFERLQADTLVQVSYWSINEFLDSDQLVQVILNKIDHYQGKSMITGDDVKDFKTLIRLGGKGLVKKATNFPIKSGMSTLSKYTTKGDTYVDPCAGWGDRLLISKKLGLHYIGYDINEPLVKRLRELNMDMRIKGEKTPSEIRLQDFTQFDQEMVGVADVIMTSPPYYDLEDYRHGDQKQEYLSYEQWLEQFVHPFMDNCFSYLKDGKYCLINVKDYNRHELVNDFIAYGKKAGLTHVGFDTLKNITRVGQKGMIDSNEDFIIFQK